MQGAPTLTTLTIGLPVHNEEKSLPEFMTGLGKAVAEMPPHVEIQTIACLNGCTDNSEKILRQMSQQPWAKKLNLSIINSPKGKLNAENEIVRNRRDNGPICFMDTDISIKPDILAKLFDKLEQDPACFASFARVEPHYNKHSTNPTYFQDALRVYYKSRELLPPKPYIHGRAFMLRDGSAFGNFRKEWKTRAAQVSNQKLVSSLSLNEGPWADDVYLSRVIAHTHGVNSICEVPEAKVYFHPTAHEVDYCSGIRRLAVELKRLELLFPEYEYLEEEFAKGHQVKPDSLSDSLTSDELTKLKYIKGVERHCWKNARQAVQKLDYDSLGQDELWQTTSSTKKSFSKEITTEIVPYDPNVPPKKVTSVLVVPLTEDGKVVAVKNKRGWDLPGGHVESTDRDYFAVARREAQEEAQTTLRNPRPVCMIKFKSEATQIDTYMVVMGAMVGKTKKFTPTDEISERAIISIPHFLKRYEAGNAAQMGTILDTAAKALSIDSYCNVGRY